MLKGIVIAVSDAELLKQTLTRDALPWVEEPRNGSLRPF